MSSIHGSSTRVGKDGYQNMLLDIEWPPVECELKPCALEEDTSWQSPCHEVGNRNHSNLCRNGGDTQRLCSVPKELIHNGQEHTRNNTKNPHSECEKRHGGVISFRHGEFHLLNWALFILNHLLFATLNLKPGSQGNGVFPCTNTTLNKEENKQTSNVMDTTII